MTTVTIGPGFIGRQIAAWMLNIFVPMHNAAGCQVYRTAEPAWWPRRPEGTFR